MVHFVCLTLSTRGMRDPRIQRLPLFVFVSCTMSPTHHLTPCFFLFFSSFPFCGYVHPRDSLSIFFVLSLYPISLSHPLRRYSSHPHPHTITPSLCTADLEHIVIAIPLFNASWRSPFTTQWSLGHVLDISDDTNWREHSLTGHQRQSDLDAHLAISLPLDLSGVSERNRYAVDCSQRSGFCLFYFFPLSISYILALNPLRCWYRFNERGSSSMDQVAAPRLLRLISWSTMNHQSESETVGLRSEWTLFDGVEFVTVERPRCNLAEEGCPVMAPKRWRIGPQCNVLRKTKNAPNVLERRRDDDTDTDPNTPGFIVSFGVEPPTVLCPAPFPAAMDCAPRPISILLFSNF